MINIEEYKKKRNNNRRKSNSIVNKYLIKTMICVIIFLIFIICRKRINGFENKIYEKVYSNNFLFAKFNSWYKNNFGNILPIKEIEEIPVFDENIVYSSKEKYYDGVKLHVDNNYLVPLLSDGIVIYKGEKEKYGYVLIIQDENGVETWYSNIEFGNINMYDYLKKGDYLGEAKENSVVLLFMKKGKVEDYEKYI